MTATQYLNSLSPNTVREAATYYFDASGADWDGTTLSLSHDGKHWYRHSEAMVEGLARYLKRNPN